jgi:hypothetical protein
LRPGGGRGSTHPEGTGYKGLVYREDAYSLLRSHAASGRTARHTARSPASFRDAALTSGRPRRRCRGTHPFRCSSCTHSPIVE